MKTDPQNSTLQIFREEILGEVRHRIVRRKRDGTYWTTRDVRAAHGYRPLEVPNQNGHQWAAEILFARNTGK